MLLADLNAGEYYLLFRCLICRGLCLMFGSKRPSWDELRPVLKAIEYHFL